MGRYTGPVCRICRRAGEKLYLKGEKCLTPKCPLERRRYAPGQHGMRRRKLSEYGIRLREKQKARFTYGLMEEQFRRFFEEAERLPGVTGENLLQLLERRLDNVVYRLGFADSRRQARQLVTHGHFALNGRRNNIPSTLVEPGDVISVMPSSRDLEYFKQRREFLKTYTPPNWLSLDPENLTGRVLYLPSRAEIDTKVNEALIVEYYSR